MLALLAFSGGLLAQTIKTWTAAGNGSWADGSNWSGGTVPGTNDIVVFDQGITATISAVPSTTVTAIRVIENSTVTFTATGDRTINLRGGGGTQEIRIESGSSLILPGGTSSIQIDMARTGSGGGNVTGLIEGTLSLGQDCTFDTDNGNTAVTVTGSNGRIEVVGANVDIQSTTGSLVFGAGGTYSHETNGGEIPTATWNNASNCVVTGVTTDIPTNTSFAQEFGNVTWNCPNQTSLESFATQLSNIDGNFTVESTGSGELTLKISGPGTGTTTVDGDLILNGGALYITTTNGNQTLNVLGDIVFNGGTLGRAGTGTANVVFSGTGLRSFTKTSGSIIGVVNFQIPANAEVDFGTSVLDGSTATFTLSADGKIITGHPDGIYSSGSTGAIQVGGTRTFSNDAIYEFRGARTGTFSTTGNDVQGLVINNTSGEVLLERPFDVTTSLTLTNGYATTGTTNIITVGTGGTSTSSNGAFVNGIIAKSQSNTTAFTFHVGSPSAGGLRPISLTSIGGGGTSLFTAQFYRANPITSITNGNVLGSGLARVSACEYWTLDRSGGGTRSGVVTIDWVAASNCSNITNYITNVLTLRVARHNGTSWVDAGATLVGGSTVTVGSIRTGAVQTQFSPFALASSNTADNPLPVLFDGVRAFGKNDGVQIEWSNLTERDIVRYEVERSANGIDFYSINEQAPKSNRDDKASYTHFDAAPLTGANYYRIRVDEIGGKAVYSKILRVEIGSTKKAGYSVYPNPVTGRQFTLSLNGLRQGAYTLQVLNASGMRVHTQVINNVGAGVTEMIQLPASLQTGVYITVVIGDNYRESKQLIVK